MRLSFPRRDICRHPAYVDTLTRVCSGMFVSSVLPEYKAGCQTEYIIVFQASPVLSKYTAGLGPFCSRNRLERLHLSRFLERSLHRTACYFLTARTASELCLLASAVDHRMDLDSHLSKLAIMPKCTNTSCGKEFDPATSGPQDCAYHPGGPVSPHSPTSSHILSASSESVHDL